MRIVGFGLVMFIPSQFQSNVSYRTHYIGLAVGLAVAAVYGPYALKGRNPMSRSAARRKIEPRPGGSLH
jgi:hypothetical protein